MSMRGGSMRGGRGGGGGQRGGRGGTFRGGAGRGPAGPPPIFMKGLPVAQPDPEVTKHENAIVAAPKSASAGLSLQDRLPARPGYGTVGIHITLRTNYFKLEANPDAALYRYTVQFLGPNTDPSKRLKQRCLEMLIADAIFAGTPPATDYANTIITSKKVDFGSEDRKEIVIELSNPGEEPFPSKTPAVQFDRSIAFKELLDYLHSNLPGAFYPDKADAIQALNIVLGKFARGSHGMIVAGQNKFYMTQAPEMEKLNLGGGLEALRGYYTSVRTSVARLLVNVNVATGAFYKDGPLLELMRHFKDDNNAQDPRFNAKLSAFLKGVRVETSYMKRSDKKTTIKKVKTVLGLCRSPAGGHSKQIKFEYTEPNKPTRNVTVEEYFKIVYNIQLKTPFAPVVNTEAMLGFAARIPKDNAEFTVNKGLVLLGLKSGQSQAQLARLFNGTSYGLRLPDPQMLTVDGRILPPPTIQYQQSFMPQPGTWNLRGVRFCKPTALPSWALVRAGNPKFEFEQPLEEFVKGLKNYGMKYTPFKMTTNFSLMPEDTLESRLDNFFTHISAQRITLALHAEM
ncbi:hypothetical protein B0A49_03604 [Cryomyces minteri]|uniref:PAZ domain-containing protein n=1 Tax=Cryomyces minteri TaxID=331657 RepID=A0A4U0XPL2_9PEZI|nr:hypothetical protein B0A49_03604 [Cryomyces minteri]